MPHQTIARILTYDESNALSLIDSATIVHQVARKMKQRSIFTLFLLIPLATEITFIRQIKAKVLSRHQLNTNSNNKRVKKKRSERKKQNSYLQITANIYIYIQIRNNNTQKSQACRFLLPTGIKTKPRNLGWAGATSL